MARAFILIFLTIAVFCLGQWCASEGYTIKKAWGWAYYQMDSSGASGWLNDLGLGHVSSFMKKADSPRSIPGSSVMKAMPSKIGKAILPQKIEPFSQALVRPIPQLDEEGLSPTDREALIGLLK